MSFGAAPGEDAIEHLCLISNRAASSASSETSIAR
jgi:hypothetical protein